MSMRIKTPVILPGSGNVNFDTRFNDKATMLITSNVTLSLSAMESGQTVSLFITQDEVGSHILTIEPVYGTDNVANTAAGIDASPGVTTIIVVTRIGETLNIAFTPLSGNVGFSDSRKIGKTYEKSTWTDLSDFAVNTAAATVSLGKILLPSGGVTDFTKSLQLSSFSCVNHWKIEMEFQLTTAISGSTTGISLGIQSTNSDSLNSWAVYFSCSTTNTGRMEFFGQSNGGAWASISPAAANLTFVANDLVRLSLERINQQVIMRAENLTNPVAPVYHTYTAPYNTSPIAPNTGHFALWCQGGTFTVSNLTVYNNELKNANVLLLGDSKTMGYGASNFYTTYPGLLGRLYSNIAISGGFGDKTSDLLNHLAEIINLAPRQVLLMIGSNDARFGVLNSTFQANYTEIVNQLEAAGIEVIHLSPTFELGLDLTAQYDFVKDNFSPVIDLFYKSTEAGMLYSGDNIHWSDIMNRDAVQIIKDSNILIGAKTDQEFYQ